MENQRILNAVITNLAEMIKSTAQVTKILYEENETLYKVYKIEIMGIICMQFEKLGYIKPDEPRKITLLRKYMHSVEIYLNTLKGIDYRATIFDYQELMKNLK